ncbi:MAG TPA: DUF4261 domain-containing protein [Acidimicrobiales bacterium]|nr:DUF4261 domain-containing protein [Acidimicrobiales bacterium]
MPLLEAPRPVTTDSLLTAWRSAWPGSTPPSDFDTRSDEHEFGAMTFAIEGMRGALVVVPAPIPAGELDGPAATSWLWPDAPQEIERVNAHVVTWVSGAGRPLDAYRHLTRLVSAVLRATDGLGVYWGTAAHVIRADVFDGIAHRSDEDALPVMLWVDFRAFAENAADAADAEGSEDAGDGRSALFTVGLSAFGLMELEIAPSDKRPGELRELGRSVASYLIENGPVLGDGDTVGAIEDQPVVVRHAPSMVDRPGTVYRLEGA